MTAIDIKEWKQWRKGEGCGEAKKDGCRGIRQCNHLSFKSAYAEDKYYSTFGSGTSIHWMPAVP